MSNRHFLIKSLTIKYLKKIATDCYYLKSRFKSILG
jgi:hypothetical protein